MMVELLIVRLEPIPTAVFSDSLGMPGSVVWAMLCSGALKYQKNDSVNNNTDFALLADRKERFFMQLRFNSVCKICVQFCTPFSKAIGTD